MEQLIDIGLWDRAVWKGVMFGYDPTKIPFMALLFANREPALELFKGLQQQIGMTDEGHLLRIAIIEGDIPGEKAGYTVHIGINEQEALKNEPATKMFMLVSRIHRMNPAPGSSHLAGFKREFERQRRYGLMPASLSSDGQFLIAPEGVILKTDIAFRNVTDIGRDDIDRAIFVREEHSPKH